MPEQDIGIITDSTEADTDISLQTTEDRQRQAVDVLLVGPAIDTVASTIGVSLGWSALNRGGLIISLKA